MSPKTSGEAFDWALYNYLSIVVVEMKSTEIMTVQNTDASSLDPSRIHTHGLFGHEKNLENRRASWWRCYWWSGDTPERGVLVRKFRPPNISFRQLRKGDERLAHLR
ncbi:hypothetical protein M407DRAFT_6487 [Tulasnella calospora MUT 4182]|uniref:Uncharacterized protein n=1 Tax=Tulasnella calospora MUT 4182 TaxID=1051891 RepID=A0A0C3M5T1_9AGAM|nr:hypothetical protein M407DRAFT_6487 [Tulasnella calospora MUT 4182]